MSGQANQIFSFVVDFWRQNYSNKCLITPLFAFSFSCNPFPCTLNCKLIVGIFVLFHEDNKPCSGLKKWQNNEHQIKTFHLQFWGNCVKRGTWQCIGLNHFSNQKIVLMLTYAFISPVSTVCYTEATVSIVSKTYSEWEHPFYILCNLQSNICTQ